MLDSAKSPSRGQGGSGEDVSPKNGEKGLGHGRPVDSVLRGWRREVMEYAVFRLAMRSLVFLVAFVLCVSHLVRKRDFIDAVFRSPDEVRKSFTGRNDVLLLRVLNVVTMVVAAATAAFLLCALLDVPRIMGGDYLRVEGVAVGRAHGGADVPSERRGISVRDGETGEVVDLTVFSGYLDDGERLAVEYLPHTGYGAIVERG